MALSVSPLPQMTASVTSGNPGNITGVSNPTPGPITYIGPNYGTQGPAGPGQNTWSTTPLSVGQPGAGGTSADFLTNATTALSNTSNNTYGLPPPVYAPKLDFAATSAQARKSAEGAVNPYYTKVMGDFLTQQAAEKTNYDTSQQQNRDLLAEQTKRTVENNATARERTLEDTTNNENTIATKADNFQKDSGTAFDVSRRAEAKAVAASGLTGGLAGQTGETSTAAHNTTEDRQSADYVKQKLAQELTKARTFEDLATSGERAVKDQETGNKKIDFDLNTFVQKQGFDLQNESNNLEIQRQDALAKNQADQQRILVRNWIDNISDPAKRNAALNAYGGLL